MSSNRYIVIVGCGRLGSQLANQLSHAGDLVVVVDRDETRFEHLSAEFSGFRIEGDATQIAVLREAKVQDADVVIASTQADNVNLMVAQIARKIFQVPQVLARVYDPKREEVYSHLGIDPICPTKVAANIFMQRLALPLGFEE